MKGFGNRGILITQDSEAFFRNAVVLVILSVGAGALSYALVETPGDETAQPLCKREAPDPKPFRREG